MTDIDYVVIAVYVLGILLVGLLLGRRVKNAGEMFAAGRRSPWWVSGLSSFMTMFSAGTFVVWGGIAYEYGLVAIVISMCYGISALFAGWTLAGRWSRLGVESAPQFLQLRFGSSYVQFNTWLGLLSLLTLGLTIYGLAVIISTLVPISIDNPFAVVDPLDPTRAYPSVLWISVAICLFVVGITFLGGLWAVLITDVLQFVVLTVSVILVVPLILMKVGGIGGFVEQAPTGFFRPTGGDFTWWFLLGWIAVHYFKIGGEWAFVQRFACVPDARQARWSAYLFGVMYLISPIFWMLPPMVWRILQPIPEGLDAAAVNNLSERAYIQACSHVLPAGMIGLMVASMISATASMATTQLNVFAAAFTREVYQRLINPDASEKRLVLLGRIITVILGAVVLCGAIVIPQNGTYRGVIIAFVGLMTGPLVLPTIWGLFSKRITLTDAWIVTGIGILFAILIKFGIQNQPGWFDDVSWLEFLRNLARQNGRVTEWVSGSIFPLVLLLALQLIRSDSAAGTERLETFRQQMASDSKPDEPDHEKLSADPLPSRIVAWTLIIIGAMMLSLAIITLDQVWVMCIFAVLIGGIGCVMLLFASRNHVRMISRMSSEMSKDYVE